MSPQNLSDTLARELTALHAKKGSLQLEDLHSLLENVAAVMKDASASDAFLRDEIARIAGHIAATKNAIATLAPEGAGSNATGDAAAQLDAVIRATEEAADSIMGATEEIQALVSASGADGKVKDAVVQLSARIYEACNFQDLTGQRIRKVVEALEITESRIRRLMELFGSDGTLDREKLAEAQGTPRNSLLNGPGLPGQAPSQSEIDALFRSLD